MSRLIPSIIRRRPISPISAAARPASIPTNLSDTSTLISSARSIMYDPS